MIPIPDHLSSHDWYRPHLAWLRGLGLEVRHDPGEAAPRRADLRGADLRGAYLRGAYLRDANLRGAYLGGANLGDAEIPVVDGIDRSILAALEAGGNLEMGAWHTCETTHCRAGWAITLAGEAGARLEERFGPATAGALIYAKSRPGLPVPDFYASRSSVALEDIRKHAAMSEES